ncbi:MAG: Nif3-like dinuclear metal center hexameric protein [Deltaproteobacteria bacterium HGW-Deltaproteobacteria-4]|nr:MAG: Nif3-like dinuclear metal center hexameric protein [Deltaproteobacteria bacterium HGW-Deltaproteobacteria-4]
MKRRNPARIQDLIGLIHTDYPPSLAEDWDNVGLQVGDPTAPLERVLIALDVTAATLSEAQSLNVQAIVSHHPLIFRPLKNISALDPNSRLLMQAISANLAIIAAHTNLDCGADGLNDWLAAKIGIQEILPLQGATLPLYKLVVYVPVGHEETVESALFAAGAGTIGAYDHCSFASVGTGRFRPGATSTPFIGTPGEESTPAEIRIETIVSAERVAKVVDKMHKVHPYEEPAYDLFLLQNRRNDLGLGRIGRLPQALPLHDYARQISAALGTNSLRLVGDPQRLVRKVACCGGSGASLIFDAQRQGADLLVTGDIKYHDARNALDLGLALIDAGHFATEVLMVAGLAKKLRAAAHRRQLPVEFIESASGQDPFLSI